MGHRNYQACLTRLIGCIALVWGAVASASLPPSISPISNAMVYPGNTVGPLAFTVGDAETAAQNLQISFRSSNSNLVQDAQIVLSGIGSNRSLTIPTSPSVRGVATISVNVMDGDGDTNSTSFVLRVEEFTPVASGLPQLWSTGIAWGDYDRDGWLDVITAGVVYRNAGSGIFSNAQTYAPDLGQSSLNLSDCDNDGTLDLALTAAKGYNLERTTKIFRNIGGSYAEVVTSLLPVYWGTAVWGDYDNNGRADLLVTGYDTMGGSATRFYHNTGLNSFPEVPTTLPQLQQSAAAWADYDADGRLDVVVAGRAGTNNLTWIYHNEGNGVLSLAVSNLLGLTEAGIDWGDFDNDGDLDLLMMGLDDNYASRMLLLRNNGNGMFSDSGQAFTGIARGGLAWGDFNNDGWSDFVVCGFTNIYVASSDALVVYLNNGSGGFSKLVQMPGGVYQVAVADYDLDGRQDILAGGQLFRNNFSATNITPSAPVNLYSVTNQGGVSLQWTAGTDGNQTGGLTYNLRVGVFPNGNQTVSALANSNGMRYVSQIGNTGTRLGALLTNIGGGTFYWSVQAIDHAGVGSSFAPEQTFTLPAVPAEAVTGTASNVTATAASLTGSVDSGGQTASVYFDYGNTTNYGFRTEMQAIGGESYWRPVSATVSNLAVGGTYHFRLAVTAGGVTNFGFDQKFITPIFSGTTNESLPWAMLRTAWGDFDADGDLDCVLSSSDVYGSKMYRNDGAGVLTDLGLVFPNFYLGSTECADFDRDGLPDFVLISSTANSPPRVMCSNGDGTFSITAMLTNYASGNLVSVEWGDYDNDGDSDILYLAGSAPRLFRNDGKSKLSDAGTPFGQLSSSAAAWGDFDGDGDLDVIIAGLTPASTNRTQLFVNDGLGSFSPSSQEFVNIAIGAIAATDWDNDGDLDILIAGSTATTDPYTSTTRLYRNDDGSFSEQLCPFPGLAFPHFATGDFDNDGRVDLFLNGFAPAGNYSQLWRNLGGLNFTATEFPPEPGDAGFVSWADFDADGDLDYLSSRYVPTGNAYRRVTFINQGLTSNIAPTPPPNLMASVVSHSVTLTWGDATDPNQAGGLSYNVRVGSASNDTDAASPQAALSTGWRRVSADGNVGNQRSMTLRNLLPGNYYWSVQTVDHGLAGSTFAAEQTFVIDGPPTISTISNQTIFANASTSPLSFTARGVETVTNQLVLQAWASNPELIPTNNIVFGGTNRNRTITITPAPHRIGKSTVSVLLTDAFGRTALTTFLISVQGFMEYSISLPNFAAGSSAWADFDADGNLDFVNNPRIYRNLGASFTNLQLLPTLGLNQYGWADFDGDGDLDLTEVGWSSGGQSSRPHFFRNEAGTNFSTIIPIGITNGADGSISWGDYDNDGDSDLLITGDPDTPASPSGRTQLFRNVGGSLTNSGVLLPGVSKSATLWLDFDRDGDLDIIMAGQTGTTTTTAIAKLYRNDGNDHFTEVPSALPGLTECAIAADDFNLDGNVDLAIAGLTPATQRLVAVYQNLGNGVFTNFQTLTPGISAATLAWGDLDNDGFSDLVISGQTNTSITTAITKIFRNEQGIVLSDTGSDLPGTYSDAASWGDFDSDGDLDLMLGSRIYQNLINAPPLPSTSPQMLATVIEPNNELRLTWSLTDINNSPSFVGKSFNIRLGTTPGGNEIVVSHSDSSSGKRRLPQMGNAGTTNFWRIAGLTNGTYFWSVQAIDAGLRGSAFAAEASFVLSRPQISTLTNQRVFPNAIISPINFTVSDSETSASNILVTAAISNPNLILPNGLVLSGSDTNRSLAILLQPNRSGQALVTISATDESGQTSSRSFELFVERFVNLGANLGPETASVAWIDSDTDGDLDLNIGTTLYRNNGGGNFAYQPITNNFSVLHKVSGWGDSDNDGDLDCMFANALFRNQGNGDFTMLSPGFNAVASGVPAWRDCDNDGRVDLAYSYGNGVHLYRNFGNNTFSNLNAGLPYIGASSGALEWGDYDNDGDADLLLAGNARLGIYRNNGRGGFANLTPGYPGLYSPAIAWGDFNNDGYLDFIACGSTNGSVSGIVTRIYCNTTNFSPDRVTFTNLNQIVVPELVSIWRGAIATGDYDGDGWLDLVLSGETTNGVAVTKVYHNEFGKFIDSGNTLEAVKNGYAAWGDFDRDGNLDLALSGNNTATRIYRNFSSGQTNGPPAMPAALSSVVNRKSARLALSGSSDGTQTNGFSYNLRIGTSSGGIDIVSPLANSNGLRYVSAPGNISSAKAWTITNLIGGTYYWSVQAIDHSYAGSAFAPEQSFTISNAIPLATALSISTPEDTTKSITLLGSDSDGDALTFQVTTTPLFGQITGNPPSLIYRPATNYAGFDQFAYVANDRTTNSLPATVYLTVTPVTDFTNSTLGITPAANGQFQLSLKGEPWQGYRIEASEDLVNWQPLTYLLATNLLTLLVDADAPNFPRRFYRAVEHSTTPSMTSPVLLQTNGFSFIVTGDMGRNYQVQASTNLLQWLPIQHVLLTNGTTPIVDENAGRYPMRFYRLK